MVELFHGYTYSGHPLASAAAEATLALYHEEKLFDRARDMAVHFENALHALKGVRNVTDIRNFGLMAGIELEPAAGRPGARGFTAFLKCFELGVMARVTGDIIALSPPLIISRAQIDELVGTLDKVLRGLE
jgi:beta-alanine--pyruvate transaminase